MKQVNQKEAVNMIAACENFRASALTGQWVRYTPDRGWLKGADYDTLTDDARIAQRLAGQVYVVKSYGTVIAWKRVDGVWHVISDKFSPTTSRHQSRVRQAVSA